MSLLEKARGVELAGNRRRPRRDIAVIRDEMDLALAFLREEVTWRQVSAVIGKAGQTNTMNWVRRALWAGVRAGLADVVVKP